MDCVPGYNGDKPSGIDVHLSHTCVQHVPKNADNYQLIHVQDDVNSYETFSYIQWNSSS